MRIPHNKVFLTDQQVADLVILHNNQYSIPQIVAKLSLPYKSVRRTLSELNLAVSNKRFKPKNGIAKCRLCKDDLPIDRFQKITYTNKEGIVIESRRGTCWDCLNAALYRSFERVLERRIAILKRGTCSLVYKDLLNLFSLQNGKCFYTDEILTVKTISVDRVDTAGIYEIGNVVLCTGRANRIKNDATLDEMRKWLPDWYNRIERFKQCHV